jgi:hypothetical protein
MPATYFNEKKTHFLTHSIKVFGMILRINSDYLPKKNFNQLVFIMYTPNASCEAGIEYLNVIHKTCVLQRPPVLSTLQLKTAEPQERQRYVNVYRRKGKQLTFLLPSTSTAEHLLHLLYVIRQ